jgi:hypothetical protein
MRTSRSVSLVVCAALALVIGAAITWSCMRAGFRRFVPDDGRTKAIVAQAQVTTVAQAITVYAVDRGHCPDTQEEVVAAGYLSLRTADPWETSLVFYCSWRAVIVTSAGADRAFNTADDVIGVTTIDAGHIPPPPSSDE